MKTNTRILTLLVALVLIAAALLTLSSCTEDADPAVTTTAAPVEVTFQFTITHRDGSTRTVSVTTTKQTVGAALLDAGLIAGEEGPYGLYVKTVDGETLDYDLHGYYWAFEINGAMAPTGVDQTNIEPGKSYAFTATAG